MTRLQHATILLIWATRPLVLYSQSGNSTYAAVYLQAILAIPQVREAILLSVDSPAPDTSTYMSKSDPLSGIVALSEF